MNSWSMKNKKAHFGHKLHTSQTVEHDIIANYAVTTASVQDSKIDLSIPGIINYKEKLIILVLRIGHRRNVYDS